MPLPTLAIDIGGTKTSAALIDEDNDEAVLEHPTWTTPPTAEEAIDQIIVTCTPWAQRATKAGISFGGQFDFPTQTCIRSMHTDGWAAIELSRRLQQALNIEVITAYANDVGYEVAFAEQLRNLAQPGDVLVTISGSGTSPNIIRAIEAAQGIGLDVVSLTGFEGGVSGPMSDIHINVPSDHMGRIEDVHMALCHAVAFSFMDNEDHTAH